MRFWIGGFVLAIGCGGADGDDGTSGPTGPTGPGTTEDCAALDRWYEDRDGDGYGTDATEVEACVAPEGFVPYGGDCDDADPEVSPDALELCDEVDQDCDGSVVDGYRTWFADADGDGYGWEPDEVEGCDPPAGYVDNALDCDDGAATVFPGAPPTDPCDLVDTDCDGTREEIVVPDDGTLDLFGAAPSGSTICLRPGTHPPISLASPDLTLQGLGADPSEVVLDGARAGSTVFLNPSASATLRNLTVTNGRATSGAGVFALLADLVVEDVVIEGNTCSGICLGVGLRAIGASVTLRRTQVRDNVAIYDAPVDEDMMGVGLQLDDNVAAVLEDVEITGNAGSLAAGSTARVEARGAGLFVQSGTLTMDRVLIAHNRWDGIETAYGVGVNLENVNATLRNVRLVGNEGHNARTLGGGLYLVASVIPSPVTLENVIVAGNVIESTDPAYAGTGAGIAKLLGYTLRATNVAVVGNVDLSATSDGTALWDWGDAPGVWVNSVIQGNRGPMDGPGALVRDGSQPTVRHCAAFDNDGGTWNAVWDPTGREGNLTADALFTDRSAPDPLDWDLTLLPGSPLIDAGDPTILDPDGSPSDLGPYGGPLGASW